jgi:surfeit locus 1 family protein
LNSTGPAPEQDAAQHHRASGRRVLLAMLLGAGALLFSALAVWQVERRGEKLALIAAVDARVHAAAVDAPGPPEWPRIGFKTDAYRHVRVHGVFLHDRETLVQAATARGPGYWVMTPLRTDSGWTVLVNRGFVPPEDRGRAGEPAGLVTVTGLWRMTEPRGAFLHSNDPTRDRWYSRDVGAIGRARHIGKLAPYFIDAERGAERGRQPVGGLTVVSFPNNHLQYAFTWGALAVLSAFGAVRVWRTR